MPRASGAVVFLQHGVSVIEAWLDNEREQLPLWTPVALGAGIAAWFLLPDAPAWMAWLCLCLASALVAALLVEGSRLRAALVGLGLLGAAGCLIVWVKAEVTGAPPLARPVFVETRGIVRFMEPLPAQGVTRLLVAPMGRADLPDLIRLTVADGDLGKGVGRDAVIGFRVRLLPPAEPAVPGAYDFAARAYFQGIGATGRIVPPLRVERAAPVGREGLRQRVTAHVLAQLPGSEGGVAAAFVTGDRGGIAEADAEAMRRSGLAHLLSISGLHVTALVGGVIFLVYRLLALSMRAALRWPLGLIAAGAGAMAAIGYTLLSGAEVPTVRSCIAALLVLGGLAMGREAITLRLVATGALVVLLFWPEALMGPSFQMSFAAVTTIVAIGEHPRLRALFHAREEAPLRRAARSLAALFVTGLAIEIVLAPIALYHFHQAGVLGALANMVAIPLSTFLIMPFEALALLMDSVGLGWPAWWVTGKAIGLLLGIAQATAAAPGAVALTPAFPAYAFGMMVLGGLWFLLWRGRARWVGLAPVVTGLAVMALTPAPDVLVTGDGRHVALRMAGGGLALLRDRAGDYVRDTLSESAGLDAPVSAMADMPGVRCGRDMCAVRHIAGGRAWRLLMTRSDVLVPVAALARDCAAADIVISDRRLPRTCTPRWLKIDRSLLRRTGGIALYLSQGRMRTVRRPGDAHPWIMRPRHQLP